MVLVVIYGLLLLMMVASIVIGIHSDLPKTTIISQITGTVGLMAAFLQALVRSSLPVYFLWQRLRIKLNSKSVTRWSFSARFDGDFGVDAVQRVTALLTTSGAYAYPVRTEAGDNRSALVSVDNSLVVSMSLEIAAFAEASAAGGIETDHFTILSKTQELPFHYSIDKIEHQILPLLEVLRNELRPSRCSYELDIDFRGTNPFFEVYISKLKPEQVGDFRVMLHVASGVPNRRERVEISKNNVHVVAANTDTFRRLASDFILLSPDVRMLTGVSKHA